MFFVDCFILYLAWSFGFSQFFFALDLLMIVDLENPVLIPGGLNSCAVPFYPKGFELGVRVTNRSSLVGGSGAYPHVSPQACTKANEVWAMFGYGHLVHQSRIRHIKRSFRRTCKRALIAGYTTYKDKCFMDTDVSFRLRGQLKAEILRPSLTPPSR